MQEKNIGRVVQVIGPVLDIRFPNGHLPDLLNAIEIEREDGVLVCEVAQQLGLGVVGAVPAVLMARQARAVADQVAQGDVLGDVVVVEADLGDIGLDGGIPVQLAGVNELGGQRAGEGLGAGADLVEGVLVGGEAALHVAQAEALAQRDLAVLDHAHGHRGAFPQL